MSSSYVFAPKHSPLHGTIHVPGDKSISHRAVILSAAADGTSHVSGVLDSDDVRSSIEAVRALGAEVNLEPDFSGALCGDITGWGATGPKSLRNPINCGNSGTTARILLGLLAGYDCRVVLKGDESLSRRPMERVTEPISRMGAVFSAPPGTGLPVAVNGKSRLEPIDYELPVASAQVKTAILLAGLHADGETTVTSPAVSRDHTERMLTLFGVDASVDGCVSRVKGPATLHPADIHVPGDPSSAAFLLAGAAMAPGSDLTVRGISLNPTRTGFLTIMRRMGAHIITEKVGEYGHEPYGNVTVKGDSRLNATTVPAEEIPSIIDEVPLLALLATVSHGTSCFLDVAELRVKESDRLLATVNGLTSLGCAAYVRGDDLYIEGGKTPRGDVRLSSFGDHRLAMVWALAGTLFEAKVELDDVSCISISYPNFIEDLFWACRERGDEDE